MTNERKIFLLIVLALVAILAVGCGEVQIEKEVQLGEPVTVGGFTNEQLRSPEFKECMEFLFYGHGHRYSDYEGDYDTDRIILIRPRREITSGPEVEPEPTPDWSKSKYGALSGVDIVERTPVPRDGYEECKLFLSPADADSAP